MPRMSLQELRTCWCPFLVALGALLFLTGRQPAKAEAGKRSNHSKPAWEWTLDERLSQRFAPKAMQARAAERTAQESTFLKRFPEAGADSPEVQGTSSSRPSTDSIEGSKTPELFLPFELFDHLLDMGFPPDGRRQLESRQIIEQRAAALGFGRDLWIRLEKAARPYLELQRANELQARAQSLRAQPVEGFAMDGEAIRYCRTRAQAFGAAKSEFGAEPFLRLLYEGVTPSLSISYVVKDGLAGHLRLIEGGCR